MHLRGIPSIKTVSCLTSYTITNQPLQTDSKWHNAQLGDDVFDVLQIPEFYKCIYQTNFAD